MNIGIIGGGAIGLLTGAYLANDYNVTIITRSLEQAKELKEHGIHLEKDGQVLVRRVNAVPIADETLVDYDLMIVTVKQYSLDSVIPLLKEASSQLLFLQNGMSHVPFVKQLSVDKDVYVGVVEHGALKTGAYSVTHTGMGQIKIATYRQDARPLLVKGCPEFPIGYEADAHGMLTKKLVVNAMVNPLTAVLGVPNGELLTNPYFNSLFASLFEELAQILQLDHRKEMKGHIEDICRKTGKNQSSMLRDIQEGRSTEVDAILGYVLTIATEKKLQAPITNSLYLMVKGKE